MDLSSDDMEWLMDSSNACFPGFTDGIGHEVVTSDWSRRHAINESSAGSQDEQALDITLVYQAPSILPALPLLSVHNQDQSWPSSPALNPVLTPSSSHSTFSADEIQLQSSDPDSEPSRSSPVTDFVFVQPPTPVTSSPSNFDQQLVACQPQTPIFIQQHVPANSSSEGAVRAKRLREEGSCWLCCIQRDSCTPGKVCDRCIKRNQRATLEHGLGCDRTKLTELKPFFTPAVITRIHEPHILKDFCAQHIKRWSGVSIKLKFNVIWTLPALECEVYEFEPKTQELLRQFQYFVDPDTRRLSRVEKVSPPLAMVQIDHEDRRKYDKYVSMIVEKHLDKFAERLYDIESEDFPTRLYRLMVRFHPDNKEEASLLHEIHRLVCTYIMCRTATIPNSQKHLLYKLHTYPSSPDAYAHAPSPRMANRQLKYLFCHLHQQILDSILKKLQQVLRSSKGPQKWTSAFIALLGLAMAFELTQQLVHVITDADAAMGKYLPRDAEYVAESACRAIDEKFAFVNNLFRWKYRGVNPLRDMDTNQVEQVLGDKGVEFVRDVGTLIAEKHEKFLFERQFVGISTENQNKYMSRLVARLFASFLSPH